MNMDRDEFPAMYEAGMTIEQVALEAGVSTRTVRLHLLARGVEMRPAGGKKGKRGRQLTTDVPRDSIGVHVAFKGTRGAHRRRGR